MRRDGNSFRRGVLGWFAGRVRRIAVARRRTLDRSDEERQPDQGAEIAVPSLRQGQRRELRLGLRLLRQQVVGVQGRLHLLLRPSDAGEEALQRVLAGLDALRQAAGQREEQVVAFVAEARQAIVAQLALDRQGRLELLRHQRQRLGLKRAPIGEVDHLHGQPLADAPGAAAGLPHGVDAVLDLVPDDGREVDQVQSGLDEARMDQQHVQPLLHPAFHPLLAAVGGDGVRLEGGDADARSTQHRLQPRRDVAGGRVGDVDQHPTALQPLLPHHLQKRPLLRVEPVLRQAAAPRR